MLETLSQWLEWIRQFEKEHPYVDAVLILLGAFILAKVINFVIDRGVSRLVAKSKTDVDDRLLALLHRPILYTVLLIGLKFALIDIVQDIASALPEVETEQSQPLPDASGQRGADDASQDQDASRDARYTGRDLFNYSIYTMILLIWLATSIRASTIVLNFLSKQPKVNSVQPTTFPIFNIGTKVVLFLIGSFVFLAIWKIDATGWATATGIVGITLGLAARDTVANLFAGIFILADQPYKVGDYVVLAEGDRGEVTRIGLRSTRILTRDDIEVTVPNANIANAKIENESGGPWVKHRIRIPVGVSYSSDVTQVRSILLRVAKAHPEVCASPEVRVRFRAFGDSSLDFELLCWIDYPRDRGRIKDALFEQVFNAFREEKVEIPFPQRDVHLFPTAPE